MAKRLRRLTSDAGPRTRLVTTCMVHCARRNLAMQGYVVGRRLVLTMRTKEGKPASGDFVSVWKR